MLVSFIIPSYNSAQTVSRCLDSIYALSLKPQEFEIIFIDDCSTDDTCAIVETYQSKFPNITLYKQPKNNRQGAARNRGVSVALGEYICFVDSDDVVTEGVVEAIQIAKNMQTDMTAYHYAFLNESGVITKEADKLSFADGQIFSGIEMQNKHPYWCSGPVAYIYNRAFIERVNYPFVEGVLYEDSDYVANHLYRAKRMTYSKELGYKAYYREGSTTRSINYKNVADYLLLGTRMMALYEHIMYDVSCMMCDVSIEEVERFAEEILEGACFNVERSCRRLVKLSSIKDVRAYYERVDSYVDRYTISSNKKYHAYYWNLWTALCLKHKKIAIGILAILIPVYKGINCKV